MNGPPNEEAAGVLTTPPTAQEDTPRSDILDEDEELRKFTALQLRVESAGAALRRGRTGYVLQRGATSFHSSSLDMVIHYLTGARR